MPHYNKDDCTCDGNGFQTVCVCGAARDDQRTEWSQAGVMVRRVDNTNWTPERVEELRLRELAERQVREDLARAGRGSSRNDVWGQQQRERFEKSRPAREEPREEPQRHDNANATWLEQQRQAFEAGRG